MAKPDSAGEIGAGALGPKSAQQVAPQLAEADLREFFDFVVPFQLKRKGIAGATVVVDEGRVSFPKGHGYRNVAKKQLVFAEDTMFRPGSVSKLFTCTGRNPSQSIWSKLGEALILFSCFEHIALV